MYCKLGLITLFVFCGGAFTQESATPLAQDDLVMCEIVNLPDDPIDYGFFIDPQDAERAVPAQNAGDDIVSPEEAAASVKVNFEQVTLASALPIEIAPVVRSDAYETREPLFMMSNPHSRPWQLRMDMGWQD
jgi:hypothetical protein